MATMRIIRSQPIDGEYLELFSTRHEPDADELVVEFVRPGETTPAATLYLNLLDAAKIGGFAIVEWLETLHQRQQARDA